MMSRGNSFQRHHYDEQLVGKIEDLFKRRIITKNFIGLIHKHDKNVMTRDDIERLRKDSEIKADIDVNVTLLSVMKRYNGWFDCLLKVVGDPFLKQTNLVEEFLQLKNELDEDIRQHQEPPQGMPSVQERGAVGSEFSLNSDLESDSPNTNRQDPKEGNALDDSLSESLQHLSLGNNENDCVKMENGRYWCPICEKELSSEIVMRQHVSGAKHEKKKKLGGNSSLSQSGSDLASPNTSFTAPGSGACEIPEENDDDEYTLKRDGTGKCHLCSVPFTSRPHAVDHLKGKVHKKKKDSQQAQDLPPPSLNLGPIGEIYRIDDDGTGECFICRISLTSKKHADDHLGGRQHKNKEKLINNPREQ